MTARHTFYTILAGIHVILVALGAAHVNPLKAQSTEGQTLEIVRSYTGSNNGYGFFAPGVSATLRPMFTLIDADGNTWTDTIDPEMSREAQLRVGSGVGMIGAFPKLTLNFVQSWAATMLGRHPTAVTVIVNIEMFEVPTMDEVKNQGKQADWQVVFPPADAPELAVFHRI